ncbi:MAG: hypothetical protein WA890_16930 [Micromonospora sp.]
MVQQTTRRPPRPVLGALGVLTAGYVTVIASGRWSSAASVTAVAAAVAAALVCGLWLGSRLAQGVVVLAMAGNLLFGFLHHAAIGWLRAANMAAALVIVVLLLVPRSSRRWFAGPPDDFAPGPAQHSDQPIDLEALWKETDAGERR